MHVGAKQQQLYPVEQQFQMCEMAGVAMINAVGTTRRRADVSMAVEHGEAIALLERTAWASRGPVAGM